MWRYREKMPYLEGMLRLSQERIAAVKESEYTHDLTSGIYTFNRTALNKLR